LQRALELDQHNVAALLGMADTYSKLGRNQEAEGLYKRSIALRPELWDGYYRSGIFYYGQNHFLEAAEQFDRSFSSCPITPSPTPAWAPACRLLVGMMRRKRNSRNL